MKVTVEKGVSSSPGALTGLEVILPAFQACCRWSAQAQAPAEPQGKTIGNTAGRARWHNTVPEQGASWQVRLAWIACWRKLA